MVKQKGNRKYSESLRHGHVRLGKRRDSGIWYATYRVSATGERRQRSCGTTLKREAIAQAEVLSTKLQNQKNGVADGSVPLDRLYQLYFEAKMLVVKKSTLRRVRASVTSFSNWVKSGKQRIQKARDVTPQRIREFQRYRIEQDRRAKRTVDNDVQNLGAVFRWAVKEGLVETNPCDHSRATGRIQLLDRSVDGKPTFTEDQYEQLVEAAAKASDILTRDMIIIFANTGLRFEELAHLTPERLLWAGETPMIEIRAHGGWSPKDPREVKMIPMLPEVEKILRRRATACKSPTQFLFRNPRQERHSENHLELDGKIAGEPARRRLKEYLRQIGVKPHRDLLWHAFRRFFVKRCMERGVRLDVLMSWTGHDTVQMALHYAKRVRTTESSQEMQKLAG